MIQALCWTLIHSLWQGLFFSVITGLVIVSTRHSSAAARYGIVCGLFTLFFISCACTFGWEWGLQQQRAHGWQFPVAVTGGNVGSCVNVVTDYLSLHAPLLVTVWCLLMLARSIRMLSGIIYLHRTRNRGTWAPPAYWSDKLSALCQQVGINKTVQLLESRIAQMPMVIGHLKPVILIPLGLLTKLPEGEIEAVLLHELAHIRRNDYLVNFLQHIVENLFFFNPGLMWMSAILREEREHCCDDLAIAETKDKVQFIQALISFKEYALRRPAYATAFPGKKGQLLHRTIRIAQAQNKTLNRPEKIFFLASWIILICLFVAWSVTDGNTSVGGNRIVSRIAQMGGGDHPDMEIYGGAGRDIDSSAMDNAPVRIAEDEQRQSTAADEAGTGLQQAKEDAEMARIDQLQKQEDAAQAARDEEERRRDDLQARKDEEQAVRDALQAKKDEEQAKKDAEQARIDAREASKEEEKARRDAQQIQQAAAEQQAQNYLVEAKRDADQAQVSEVRIGKAQSGKMQIRRVLLSKQQMLLDANHH